MCIDIKLTTELNIIKKTNFMFLILDLKTLFRSTYDKNSQRDIIGNMKCLLCIYRVISKVDTGKDKI